MIKSPFSKMVIYYFSGTGNAKSVAEWMKSIAISKNVETELINIGKMEKRRVDNIPKKVLIGFCCPTHGFNFPPILLHFIFRFPKANQNKVFIVNTRAGMKIGKYFIAGLSGIALLLSALLLKIKGYQVIGLRPIDLPSNWISLHPGAKPAKVKAMFIKRKEDTQIFITQLLEGKKVYTAFKDIIQDIILAPIAIGYYFVGRFIFAKSFIASKDCNHCNICVEACPVNAIKIIDQRCYWTYHCESCMQCMNNCPQRAIETAHGFVIGLSYIIYAVLLVWIYRLLAVEYYVTLITTGILTHIFLFIIESAIYLFIIFSGYRVMHYLLRFMLFERIIIYSSLTKYKFWRRYNPKKDKLDR